MNESLNPQGERSGLGLIALRYLFGLISIALATGIRLLLDPVLGDTLPYPTLLLAVLATAAYGGAGPAVTAVITGAFSADYFLVLPRGSFGLTNPAQYLDLSFFLASGIAIALLGGSMRAARVTSVRDFQHAREAREQSEERLRLTLRSSGVAVWSWEIASNVITADDNCSIQFGLPVGQFPETVEGFGAMVHPDDRERVQREVAGSVEQGAEYKTEFRVVWPDGSVRSLAARGKVY